MTETKFSRRYFFYGSLLAGAVPAGGFGSTPSLSAAGFKSVLDRLNVAGIGFGNRGSDDLGVVSTSENIVALCDVNWDYAARVFQRYPKATKHKDFRKMFDAEGKNFDAVIIGTPDHSHCEIGVYAMQRGKHVYCEKPLTHTVWEARLMLDAARKYKVATQMGNQGYSHEAIRVAAEIFWSGEIGEVKEVHTWTGGIYIGGDNVQSEPVAEPIPDALDWDLWLGPAPRSPTPPISSACGAPIWTSVPAGRWATGWSTAWVRRTSRSSSARPRPSACSAWISRASASGPGPPIRTWSMSSRRAAPCRR